MSDHFNDLLNFLKSKGINNPENPDSMQMKDIIGLYLQNDMTTEQFKSYFKFADPGVKSVMEGLDKCISSNTKISEKVIHVIQTTIGYYNDQIQLADTIEERREIRKEIEKLIIHSREEAEKVRKNNVDMLMIGAGACVVIAGVGLAVFAKNNEVLKKGLKMVAEGAAKSL